jgi:hypothetical protein
MWIASIAIAATLPVAALTDETTLRTLLSSAYPKNDVFEARFDHLIGAGISLAGVDMATRSWYLYDGNTISVVLANGEWWTNDWLGNTRQFERQISWEGRDSLIMLGYVFPFTVARDITIRNRPIADVERVSQGGFRFSMDVPLGNIGTIVDVHPGTGVPLPTLKRYFEVDAQGRFVRMSADPNFSKSLDWSYDSEESWIPSTVDQLRRASFSRQARGAPFSLEAVRQLATAADGDVAKMSSIIAAPQNAPRAGRQAPLNQATQARPPVVWPWVAGAVCITAFAASWYIRRRTASSSRSKFMGPSH